MVIKDGRFETSFNLDGIWGGNMYAGGAGAIMPNKVTSKHNFRYVPRMDGLDIVKKLRAQIDANGYKDVDVKLIGDVPWSRGSSVTPTSRTPAHEGRASTWRVGRSASRPGVRAAARSGARRSAIPTSNDEAGRARVDRRLLAVLPVDGR